MAQAWPAPLPVKKISQETFDEAVKTNIEDFGMDPEEALQGAIEEFQMQGYDLTGIIKSAEGTNLDEHAVSTSTRELEEALNTMGADEASAIDLEPLAKLFDNSSSSETLQQNIAVALKANTVPVLIRALGTASATSACAVAAVLTQILVTPDARSSFADAEGPAAIMTLLSKQAASDELKLQLLVVAEAACSMDEENKCKFMEAGLGKMALDLLQQPACPGSTVTAACKVLKSMAAADDERPPASKAFQHARQLAQSNSMPVLAGLLERFADEDADVTSAVLLTLRQLAANNEICKEFADAGGVSKCLQVLQSSLDNRGLVAACCSALRQLTNSDEVKKTILEAHGLELLLRVLTMYEAAASVLEPALGIVTNLLLRNPEGADEAAQLGCVDVLTDLMAANPQQGQVQRQGSMAIRNMVVRNPDIRPMFLAKGAEDLLRAAKKQHPGPCRDVASAALRDLGIDNYQD